jgi:hypothetical protein
MPSISAEMNTFGAGVYAVAGGAATRNNAHATMSVRLITCSPSGT